MLSFGFPTLTVATSRVCATTTRGLARSDRSTLPSDYAGHGSSPCSDGARLRDARRRIRLRQRCSYVKAGLALSVLKTRRAS